MDNKKNIIKFGKIAKDLDNALKNLDDEQRAKVAQCIVSMVIKMYCEEIEDFNPIDYDAPDMVRSYIRENLIKI